MRRRAGLLGGLGVACLATSAQAACWSVVPQASTVSFTINQAGAPLTGTFHRYNGLVCIGGSPGDDRIRVRIETASVDTQLPELDEALRGPDFFDTARWPAARFESEALRSLGQGRYQVTGKLTLRDVTRELTVPFTLRPAADGGAELEGRLRLKRLDYGIGRGQWADTRWVGDRVEVSFSVALKPLAGQSAASGAAGKAGQGVSRPAPRA